MGNAPLRVGFLLFELHKRPTADGNEQSKALVLGFFLLQSLLGVPPAVDGQGENDASVEFKELSQDSKRVRKSSPEKKNFVSFLLKRKGKKRG